MLTLKALEEFGANVTDGMNRCLGNEEFYLRLVSKALETTDMAGLKSALEQGDLAHAFELCHGMKGVFGNLSLTPLYTLSCEMTEHLRSREQMDYSGLYASLQAQMDALEALCH